MESTEETLFSYLRDVIYSPSTAALDIKTLPEEFHDFGRGLQFFVDCVIETSNLTRALSKGDLNTKLPSRSNEIAAPLKSLHSSLKHLTWQAQQIAQGDYNQKVDFMGEFSEAFNTMVSQLSEREQNLNNIILQLQDKTASLEQSNHLLTTLMHYVPQQIIVLDRNTRDILLMNDIASNEVNGDPDYLGNLMQSIALHNAINLECEVEISYARNDEVRFFTVKTYLFEWNSRQAEVLAISDITATKSKIQELQGQAYIDGLTGLFNRNFGMFTLDAWLHDRRNFVLVFCDLDNLKYVNDEYGHSEGDLYILNAAKQLKTFSKDAIVCRLGGDEFMILAQNISLHDAHVQMNVIFYSLQNDGCLRNKSYSYSISFGICHIDRNNTMSASEILHEADELMYESKRARKKARLGEPIVKNINIEDI